MLNMKYFIKMNPKLAVPTDSRCEDISKVIMASEAARCWLHS
jgi:hypothetical protein